jgi:SPP1 family predicted phage head-tail adaptor
MQPGQLSRRIQIQTQSTTQDTFGSPLNTWTTEYQCWAAINVKSQKQTYSTAEFISKNTLDILVRWTSSFTFQPNQRIVYTENSSGVSHVYNIESISNPDQANRTVTLTVYELNGAE